MVSRGRASNSSDPDLPGVSLKVDEEHLPTTNFVLTPLHAFSDSTPIVLLSEYIGRRDGFLCDSDAALILGDLRQALAYLRSSMLDCDWKLKEENIVVQVVWHTTQTFLLSKAAIKQKIINCLMLTPD